MSLVPYGDSDGESDGGAAHGEGRGPAEPPAAAPEAARAPASAPQPRRGRPPARALPALDVDALDAPGDTAVPSFLRAALEDSSPPPGPPAAVVAAAPVSSPSRPASWKRGSSYARDPRDPRDSRDPRDPRDGSGEEPAAKAQRCRGQQAFVVESGARRVMGPEQAEAGLEDPEEVLRRARREQLESAKDKEKRKVKKYGQSSWRNESGRGYWKSDEEMRLRQQYD
eukprot:m51a1_g7632 hypothetical protein (226) ;mRNA; r:325064-325879